MMKSRMNTICSLFLTVILLNAGPAMAAKIYQWTDDEGVVHFSDTPPATGAPADIQEIEYMTFASEHVDSDEYSIINQLERMAEWRRQTEEERLAQRQLQLEEKRLAREQNSYRLNAGVSTSSYYPATYYYPPYGGYFGGYNKGHGHFWPGHFPGKNFGGHGNNNANNSSNTKLDHYKAGPW